MSENKAFMIENKHFSDTTQSNRVIATPSRYAQEHYLYVQEVGILKSLSPHLSTRQNLDSYLFIIVLDGEGTITCKGKVYHMEKGGCALIDCRQKYSHLSSKDNPWTLMWVHFNGREAHQMYRQFLLSSGTPIFQVVSELYFKQILDELLKINRDITSLTELMSNKLITDILTQCFVETVKKDNEEEVGETIKVKLLQVRDYLDTHYMDKVLLDELAEKYYISKFHLSREFKRLFGVTIGTYILSLRIGMAKRMLRFSDRPIEEIADSCGIPDTSYFTKVFRRSEQMTALEYRKKWGSVDSK